MKRNRATASPAAASPPEAKRGVSGRRPKSSQACQSCRKHKTRCELLDSSSYIARCHRCEVLSIPCSFETDAPRSITANDPSPLSKIRQSAAKALLTNPKPRPQSQSPTDPPTIADGESCEDSPWDFLVIPGLTDWTATPILGMRVLSRMACPDKFPRYAGTVNSLSDILSEAQKQWLLNFFENHYEPWLSLPPGTLLDDDTLDLVRCTISSRHLDPLTRCHVFPALRHLVEQVIMQHVFNPMPSMAVIQTFIILSLWSPFENLPPASAGSHDSRLIIASAVSMGKTLRLHESESKALDLYRRNKNGHPLTEQEAAEYPKLLSNCCIWLLLRIVESMACFGTDRSLTGASTEELEIKRFGILSNTLENVRMTRLLLSARIFQLAEKGLQLDMPEDPDNYDAFYDTTSDLLSRVDVLDRVIVGLPVVSEFDRFYLRTLAVYYNYSRLVVLVRIIRLLRTHVPNSRCNNGFLAAKFRRTGALHAIKCARTSLVVSDSILATILSTQEDELLATAPDAFFSMVSFAAAFLVMAKFMLLHSHNIRRIPGCTDELLSRSIIVMNKIATAPDHPAARCAKVMSDFIATWEAKISTCDAKITSQRPQSGTEPQDFTNSQEPTFSSASSTTPTSFGMNFSPVNMRLDNSINFDQDAVFGDEFWEYISSLPPMPLPSTPFALQTDSLPAR